MALRSLIKIDLSNDQEKIVAIADRHMKGLSEWESSVIIYWLSRYLGVELFDAKAANKLRKNEVAKDIEADYGMSKDKSLKADKKKKTLQVGCGLFDRSSDEEDRQMKLKAYRQRVEKKKASFKSLKDLILWYIQMKETEFVRAVFFERAETLREDDDDIILIAQFVIGGITPEDFLYASQWPKFFSLVREALHINDDNERGRPLH